VSRAALRAAAFSCLLVPFIQYGGTHREFKLIHAESITNILAGAPEGQRIEAAFDECIRSESRLKDLDVLDGLVYARREY
ncbi:hypothetical protein ABRY59_25505, partial [Ralstonia pseudosolanacearum]